MRARPRPPFLTLRELVHHLARYAPSGLSMHQIAAALGQDYTQFNNALSGQERARFDCDLVMPTIGQAGGRRLAGSWFAVECDGAFADLSRISRALRRGWEAGRAGDVALLGLEASGAFGDVANGLSAALADGRLTPAERKALTHEIWETIEALLVLDFTLEKVREEEG